MPVNKAQLLRGRRSKDKNENKPVLSPAAAAATCPSPRMEIAA